jgi:hypothetical protein
MSLAFRGDVEPIFSLKGSDCIFRLVPAWRTAVALLVFNRLLRLRRDAIFFHASSVALGRKGVLFVGPKGHGKSTTALALAARGHAFLGDDTACYLPVTGELLPCRRSVGIRPGPRADAIDRALVRAGRNVDDEPDRVLRIDVEALMTTTPAEPAVLGAVVFLDSFAATPQLTRREPTRREIAQLQPVVGSLVNAPPTRRVFEMAHLLSRVAVYRLNPGAPDETAAMLEQTLG